MGERRECPPKDVCPECGTRGWQVYASEGWKGNNFLRPVRCCRCGHVHAMCDLKRLTPEERPAARERKLAKMAEWREAHREHNREYMREYNRLNRDEINRKLRAKWRSDPEWRERRLKKAAEYQAAHREQHLEASKRYYRAHRQECYLRTARCKLKALRRESGNG